MAAYREIHLDNDLQISAYQLPHLHSLEMGIYFKGGSLYENRSNQGISHLLEHLCFRNLNGLPLEQLYRRLDAMGTELNGTTYGESVVFNLRVAPRFFDAAFDIMLRLFSPGKWTEEEISAEKQVVLRQIENWDEDFLSAMDSRYWRNGALPGMGTAGSVNGMSAALIHQWKRKIFRPANACFVLTGNFSDGMLQNAAEVLGDLKDIGPSLFEQPLPPGYCMRDESSNVILNGDHDLAKVLLSFDIGPNLLHPACANMLSHMTGNGMSSALFMELREKQALVDDINSEIIRTGAFRRFDINYEVSHEQLVQSLETVFSILTRLRFYISGDQMERTRVYFVDNERMALDSAGSMNERLGFAWLAGGNTDESDVETRILLHAELTAENIQDAAQAIFRPDTLSCYIEKNPKKVKTAKLRDTLKKCREMLL